MIKKIVSHIQKSLEASGRARAAQYLASMGYIKEAKELYMTK